MRKHHLNGSAPAPHCPHRLDEALALKVIRCVGEPVVVEIDLGTNRLHWHERALASAGRVEDGIHDARAVVATAIDVERIHPVRSVVDRLPARRLQQFQPVPDRLELADLCAALLLKERLFLPRRHTARHNEHRRCRPILLREFPADEFVEPGSVVIAPRLDLLLDEGENIRVKLR